MRNLFGFGALVIGIGAFVLLLKPGVNGKDLLGWGLLVFAGMLLAASDEK